MKKTQKDILILGLGNEILCDDAIGTKLVDELKKRIVHPDIHFMKSCVGGLELVETIANFRIIFLIDSMKSTRGIPGSVYYLSPENFKETLHLSGLHDISFFSALKLTSSLFQKIPEQIHIFAIEVVEDQYFSNSFTPEIEKKYPEILEEINNEIQSILKSQPV